MTRHFPHAIFTPSVVAGVDSKSDYTESSLTDGERLYAART